MPNARNAKNAREKAAAMRVEADRKAARQRAIVAGSLVVVVIVLAVAAAIGIRSLQSKATAAPANLVQGGILIGTATAKPTIEIYEDFQCPACANFETASASLIDTYAKSGKVKIIYRPVAILDWASTTKYSTRSLNMVAAVVNTKPAAFPALHSALFANQPAEGGAGLTDDKLLELAVTAGADRAAVQKAMKDKQFYGWTKQVSNDLSKNFPPGSTPTVVVNGTRVENPSPTELKTVVDKAIAAG